MSVSQEAGGDEREGIDQSDSNPSSHLTKPTHSTLSQKRSPRGVFFVRLLGLELYGRTNSWETVRWKLDGKYVTLNLKFWCHVLRHTKFCLTDGKFH